MVKKICLKCLNISYLDDKEYCDYCGRKLVEFSLVCECGGELRPHFWPRFFRPWGKSITNKHCPSCGRNIGKRVWDCIKILKETAQ